MTADLGVASLNLNLTHNFCGGWFKSCWTRIYPVFANSVDPDQLASKDNWSGSTLFAIQYVKLYEQSG